MLAPRPERQVGQLVTVSLVTGGLSWVAHCADDGLLGRLVEVGLRQLCRSSWLTCSVCRVGFRSPSFDLAFLAR
jgi:hypothetical protein